MPSNPSPPSQDPPQTIDRDTTGLLARFFVNRRGATAVEFAMVSIPFITLIFATIEIALFFLVTLTLQSATSSAARQMRVNATSLAQGIGNKTGVDAFRQSICSNMSWLQTACTNGLSDSTNPSVSDGLVVDVRDPSSFSSATISPGSNAGVLGQYDGTKCFYSGQAGSVVVLRAFYPWAVYMPFVNSMFNKLANGNVVVSDTEVFQIEQNGSSNTSSATC